MNLVSIEGVRGLPKVGRSQRRMWTLAPTDPWRIPSPSSIFGEREANAVDVYWAMRSSRDATGLRVFISSLENALVSPSGLVFTEEGNLVYESVYPWQNENYIERCGKDIEIVDGAPKAHISDDVIELDVAFHAREGGETGYFHFINSILPRIALSRRLLCSERVPLLASDYRKFASDMFSLLGVEGVFHPRKWIRAKELLFPSPFTMQGDHFTRPRYGSLLIKELLDPLLARIGTNAGRKLYLSRSDANVRRISNEDEITGIFAENGFEIVTVGDQPIEEQIKLFSSASFLASAHGAGLSNMVFMPAGSEVLEILSPARLWPTFRTLAARHGLGYHAIIGATIDTSQTVEKGQGNEDFLCDASAVRFSLREIATSNKWQF